jgi:hypothetical protein
MQVLHHSAVCEVDILFVSADTKANVTLICLIEVPQAMRTAHLDAVIAASSHYFEWAVLPRRNGFEPPPDFFDLPPELRDEIVSHARLRAALWAHVSEHGPMYPVHCLRSIAAEAYNQTKSGIDMLTHYVGQMKVPNAMCWEGTYLQRYFMIECGRNADS